MRRQLRQRHAARHPVLQPGLRPVGRFAVALLTSLVLVGCDPSPKQPSCDPAKQRCDCDAGRRLSDGSCCPAWTRASGAKCEARRWRVPEKGNGVSEEASAPDVAVGADKHATLTWVTGNVVSSTVVVGEETHDGVRRLTPSRHLHGQATEPRIAVGPRGEGIVTWRTKADGVDLIHRALRDPQGAWSDPKGPAEAVSFAPGAYDPEVHIGADGEVIHIWNQAAPGDTRGVAVATRAPGKDAFSAPKGAEDVLSPRLKFANYPEVARNRRGDALITWYQSVGYELRVFASERHGIDGSFSRPAPQDAMSPAGTAVENPTPTVAENGEAAVAWRQELGGGKMAIFLATRDAAGKWQKPADLAASFSAPADFAWNNRARFTPRGELYIVWQETHGDDRAIYLAHRKRDGGWVADGRSPLRLSAPDVIAFDPWLAVGSDDEVVVVWTQHSGGEFSVVARQSASDASGQSEAERWSAITALSPRGLGNAGEPRVALGGGRAVAAWSQAGQIWMASLD